MALTNYGELKTAVANWLDDTNLTSRIPEFISLCEDRINRELRVRAMETKSTLTISSQETALPTGYLEARALYLATSPIMKLNFLDPPNFWTFYLSTQTGKPKAYTIEGENLVVGPAPDSSYSAPFLFFKAFTALSDDSDTNWIFTNARGLYLYGTLLEAAIYLEDDISILKWTALFDDLMQKTNDRDKDGRYSGDALIQRSDVGIV